MARAFLMEDGRYVAVLDETERFMLHGLMEQTRVVLSPEVESTGDAFADLVAAMGVSLGQDDQEPRASADPPDAEAHPGEERDPALDRLLPDAHRGDDAVAAEFRRLTEEGLRQRKSANLDVAMDRIASASGDRVELDAVQAPAFLTALTDVRLLLAERMGMRTEEDADRLHAAMEVMGDDDPLGYAMAWYDFLTWLQETLTQALMGEA
ncbi:DUF2017 domain-containing protein [Intrasporangium calvum]|uniref:Uncharacterized protein n=1 Tax=Intrasporangium calvum (strain ATCC 23552 / DSM 43043 / JCM 3097 / NBRC 12989 / NCIMB 10167 / NRRL B-3866 / 7 KIP) TaxID=710696 RepID=E6S689_INTC7|nr:DUF2017 domain-containing protein [Intrasporangium calvum]ADU47840.1 Domain of unknown function DUF2017 [Intrasporangium calvum DSM 43043]